MSSASYKRRTQWQIAQTAKELLKSTAVFLFSLVITTEFLIPLVTDRVWLLLWFVLNLSVGGLAAMSVICGVLAVSHGVWYMYRRSKARSPTPGGGS